MPKFGIHETEGAKMLGIVIAPDGIYFFLVFWEGGIVWQAGLPTTNAADLCPCGNDTVFETSPGRKQCSACGRSR
jgi:hypothetical protein